MKLGKKEKEELSKRFNISIATFYNWEKNKPELIKIIELGLIKEEEIKNSADDFQDLGKVVKEMYLEMQDMKNKFKIFEDEKLK